MRSTRRKLASTSFKTGVHPTPTDAAGASSGRDSKPCCSRPGQPLSTCEAEKSAEALALARAMGFKDLLNQIDMPQLGVGAEHSEPS